MARVCSDHPCPRPSLHWLQTLTAYQPECRLLGAVLSNWHGWVGGRMDGRMDDWPVPLSSQCRLLPNLSRKACVGPGQLSDWEGGGANAP